MAMHGRRRYHPTRCLIPTMLCALLLGACMVPERLQVRSGVDPRSQDDNVRFRTIYYFRVFDGCRDPAGNVASGPPLLDSLYRFRMTGKASDLFSKVRFESGILHKSEIAPFGSSVVFDDELGRHRFVSREETDAAARRNEQYDEIQRQLDLLRQLDAFVDEQQTQGGDPTAANQLKRVMTKVGDGIERQLANTVSALGSVSPEDNPTMNESKSAGAGCPKGTELRRGFQIMGPEGVATFNQDQRLVMAMTSSGEPLIGVLKELSGRMLAEHGSESDVLLPLVRENLATLRAERAVDRVENDPDVSVDRLIERIIEAFNKDAVQ